MKLKRLVAKSAASARVEHALDDFYSGVVCVCVCVFWQHEISQYIRILLLPTLAPVVCIFHASIFQAPCHIMFTTG